MALRYISFCSGVEAASLAWEYMGWEPVAFSEVEPFPCAVLKSRWPNVPNLGDLTKIRTLENGDIQYERDGATRVLANDGRPIDICVGGIPCFVAGTMVLTPEGYVPIETLKVGDEVINADGEVDFVDAVGHRKAKIGQLKIYGRAPIACTPGHPFLAINMKRDERRKSSTYATRIPVGEYEYTPAFECVGKYIGRLPIDNTFCDEITDNDTGIADDDLLELAGWYVGDGYIRRQKGKNKKGVVFALVSKHKLDAFESRFKDVVKYCMAKNDGKIIVYKTKLAEWLIRNFGEHADKKRIPYWLYRHSGKKSFLRGYESTDGHTMDTKVCVSTVSKALAYGYADLSGNGSVAHLIPPKQRVLEGRTINQKPSWTCSRIFNENPRVKKFNNRYASIARRWEDDGTTGTVFNISVRGKHTYIVEGIAVHNCQSFSIAGKREGLAGKSGLVIDYIRRVYELAAYRGCRYVLYENVPGLLSSGGGNDLAVILSGLVGREVAVPAGGWGNAGVVANATDGNFGVAYRILDAQYTRVAGFPRAIPQRRRRVFVVGCLGSWQRAAEVLFERGCLQGNPAPRRFSRQDLAEGAGGRAGRADQDMGDDAEDDEGCGGRSGDGGDVNAFSGSGEKLVNSNGGDVAPTLTAKDLQSYTSDESTNGGVYCQT